MFSIQKIMVLVAVITAVFGLFRVVGQLQKLQKDRESQAKNPPKKRQDKATAKTVELSACARCGAFVPNGYCNCGKS